MCAGHADDGCKYAYVTGHDILHSCFKILTVCFMRKGVSQLVILLRSKESSIYKIELNEKYIHRIDTVASLPKGE